jgi:type I restriction enzyme, R subunit
LVFLSEASLEEARLAQFVALGYARGSDELIGPDSKHAERESHDGVFLRGRLEAAVARLNPGLPEEARHPSSTTRGRCARSSAR